MSVERLYKIKCDGANCRDWIMAKGETLAEARKWARQHGYRTRPHPSPDVRGLRDFCPRHRP